MRTSPGLISQYHTSSPSPVPEDAPKTQWPILALPLLFYSGGYFRSKSSTSFESTTSYLIFTVSFHTITCHYMSSFSVRERNRNFWSVKRRLAPSHSKVNTVCWLTCAKIAVSMDRHHNYSNVKAIDRPVVIATPSNVLRMEDAWRKMCAALMTRAVQQLWWSTTR
jgi:hypothetical protein